MSFSQLRVGSDLLQAYKKNHIGEPTSLQKRLIQAIREGGDVLVYDPSGSEAEIGYLTSLLDFLAKQERKQGTRAVIISPDPKRLEHLDRWIRMITEELGVTTALVGPESESTQIRNKIAAGPSIILATPSELAAWMEENRMILRDASWYILDQVSSVEDWRSVDVISQRIIGNQQRIAALSAEDEASVDPLKSLLRDPIVVQQKPRKESPELTKEPAPEPAESTETEPAKEPEASPEEDHGSRPGLKTSSSMPVESQPAGNDIEAVSDSEEVPEKTAPADETPAIQPESSLPDPEKITLPEKLTQYYIQTPPRMKISTLLARLAGEPRRSVIFTASQRTADRLYRILRKNNHRAVSLGPSVEEAVRSERLSRFENDDVPFLIAGESSAADLPLTGVEQVIHYDVPEEVSEYKLRAELLSDKEAGLVLSLVSKQDRGDIREIIEQLGFAPEELPLPDAVQEEIKQRSRSSAKKDAAPKNGGQNKKEVADSSEPPPKKEKSASDESNGKKSEKARSASKGSGRSGSESKGGGRGKGRNGSSSRSGGGKRHGDGDRNRTSEPSRRTGKKKPRPQRGPQVDPDAPIRLPKPSFDKLSGGRSGKHEEKGSGFVRWVKKLFS